MPKKRPSGPKSARQSRRETKPVPSSEREPTDLIEAPVKAYQDEVATEVDIDLQAPEKLPRKSRIPEARTPVPTGARPGQRMPMRGTKAAGALAARVKIMDLERQLPKTDIPALKLLRAQLQQDEIETLEKIIKGHFDDRQLEGASRSPKRAIERLIHHEVFQSLDKEPQAIIFREIAQSPTDIGCTLSVHQICDSGVIEQLDRLAQTQFFEMFRELDASTRNQLATAAHRKINGTSVLLDRDFRDSSALQHLFELSRRKNLAPVLEKAGYDRRVVLRTALTRLAQPGQIYAEVLGPGVLSMLEFALTSYTPAEMARYWTELTSKAISISLPKESTLQLHRLTVFDEIMGPMGAIFEQLLPLAHPRGIPSHESLVMPGSHCLDADVIARCLYELYGLHFRVIAEKEKVMDYIRVKRPHPQRVPPIFFSTIVDDYERLFILDHCEENSVYARAPHGGSLKTKSSRRIDPLRTVFDPQIGQDIISLETLDSCIGVVIAPRN